MAGKINTKERKEKGLKYPNIILKIMERNTNSIKKAYSRNALFCPTKSTQVNL
jgi:hypothetical protein